MRINKTCKTCNKPFSISDNEQKWLKERRLELFARCSKCREELNPKKSRYAEIGMDFGNLIQIDMSHPNILTTLAMLGDSLRQTSSED